MITPNKSYDCPLPKGEAKMNYVRSEGFMYEIAAVRDSLLNGEFTHDDVIKWKHIPRYWPFVRGIHRSSVNSP